MPAANSPLHYKKFMPKRQTKSVKGPKHTTVIMTQARRAGQKPTRGNRTGKVKNMGSVGTTCQNVYQAWFVIVCYGWFST